MSAAPKSPSSKESKIKPFPAARLLYENGPNWHYAVGIELSDPALWYQSPKGVTHVVVSELEYDHLRHSAQVDVVHSFGQARKALNGAPLNLTNLVRWLMSLETKAPVVIDVPRDFAAGLFLQLQADGLPLRVASTDLFFPQRALKTPEEVKKLRAAQALNEQLFEHAFTILEGADIAGNGTLVWEGAPLSAEILQAEINGLAARLGARAFSGGPIVACGPHSAVPHDRGSGVLRANQFIVIDSFPRHANGYWGDLTRTVVKGTPSGWHSEIHHAVLEAQRLALKLIKPGVNGKDIHAAVCEFFTRAGFATGTTELGSAFGYFHGTGHGVGLELHDPGPRTLSSLDCPLQVGHVTSVEPGLYYPKGTRGAGVGGCRIEDVVVVTETGHRNLTKLDKARWVF